MVCVVGNKSKDIGMGIRKSIQCGVIPTSFGCFLGIGYMNVPWLQRFRFCTWDLCTVAAPFIRPRTMVQI